MDKGRVHARVDLRMGTGECKGLGRGRGKGRVRAGVSVRSEVGVGGKCMSNSKGI